MGKKTFTVHTPESLRERCTEDGDCLIWQGYSTNKTPMVSHNGQLVSVRRLFTTLIKGQVRSAGYYTTSCGTNGCVEPSHIVWRSQSQHSRAMAKTANGSISVQLTRRAKISATKRRISDEALHDIRHSNESGPVLAERYGISRTTVNNYRRASSGRTLATNPWAGLLAA